MCLGGPCLPGIYYKFGIVSRIPEGEREREREPLASDVARSETLLYANLEPLFGRRYSTKMDRLANEGQSGREYYKVIVLLSLTIGDLARVYTRIGTSSFGSNGAAAATTAATRVYRHSRLDKNSAGFRDSELEALYRERRGLQRHVSRIQSNKLRGIGNRRSVRSRAQDPYALSRLYFPCSRVYIRRARYTTARGLPTTLLRSLAPR